MTCFLHVCNYATDAREFQCSNFGEDDLTMAGPEKISAAIKRTMYNRVLPGAIGCNIVSASTYALWTKERWSEYDQKPRMNHLMRGWVDMDVVLTAANFAQISDSARVSFVAERICLRVCLRVLHMC